MKMNNFTALGKRKMKHPEYELQKQVCKYLDYQYPKVIYMSDTIAACKLTIPQQVRNKAIQKEGFKCPDLLIFYPKGVYHGLFIELKVETPYLKDGKTLKANQHIKEQDKTMDELRRLGYMACFAWSFEGAVYLIDNYMEL
jgi:hypothetical protein